MFLNILIGLIIPWILMVILYFRDKKVLLMIAPFTVAISFTINVIAFHYGFWDLYPFGNKLIAHVPFDIGAYPMLAAYMIYYINHKNINPFSLIFFFTLLTTCIEGAAVIMGRVVYRRGWNICGTFISYLITYPATFALLGTIWVNVIVL